MNILLATILYRGIAVLHIGLILGLIASVISCFFLGPWYIGLPLLVWILQLPFIAIKCPLTTLENKLRHAARKPKIKFFHYYFMQQPKRGLKYILKYNPLV